MQHWQTCFAGSLKQLAKNSYSKKYLTSARGTQHEYVCMGLCAHTFFIFDVITL